MKIIHKPNVGMIIKGIPLKWGMSRSEIRKALNCKFEEINNKYKVSDYLPGAEDLNERKDIYNKSLSSDAWFTLIYDADDLLKEFELHEADSLIVDNVDISFSDLVPDLKADLLKSDCQFVCVEGSEENILIPSLLTNFASADEVGGDGKNVSYIYCSENIDHLLDDEL